ncbi:MAG: DUF3810 family protein [Desulfuromonadaceae bacterium]|nr:DUF3810 family protein [Desulfuromonadaceae bacterium]
MIIKKISALLMITVVLLFSGCGIAFTKKQRVLDYFETEYIESPSIEIQEQDIENLYGVDFDILFGNFNYMGSYNWITNIIEININLPLEMFGTTYAHEIQHSLGTHDEAMTNYLSYIKLWESEIEYLKYQVYLDIYYMTEGYYSEEYICINELNRYVKENR